MTSAGRSYPGDDIATFMRLQAPTPIVLARAVTWLAESGLETISSRRAYEWAQENGLATDGWSICTALAELGLLRPIEDRQFLIPERLRNPTLPAQVSAQLFLERVAELIDGRRT